MTTQTKQTEIQIERTIEMVEVEVYRWDCPGCGELMAANSEPYAGENNRYLHCASCQEDLRAQREAEFVEQFKHHHAHLIGATITDLEPDMEYWHDYDPESVDILKVRLTATNGKEYQVTTTTDWHVVFISEYESE